MQNAKSIGNYAFRDCRNLRAINLPGITKVPMQAMAYCNALQSVDFPYVTTVENSAFHECKSLASVNLPLVTKVSGDAFRNCTALTELCLPKATRLDANSLRGCSALAYADFPELTRIDDYTFPGCKSLTALVLRSETVATIVGPNAFSCNGEASKISEGTGYIYVPSALIEQYRTASVWSTFANQFRKLEEWTVDGTVTGEINLNQHMVRFFDEDGTLLGYQIVPTGSAATFDEPVKEGEYVFTGWNPSPTNVTADMDCYAQFASTAIVSRKLMERTISSISNEIVTSIGRSAFSDCTELITADFPSVTSIGVFAFLYCAALTALILRSEQLVSLSKTNAFSKAPIESGTGYIYVPAALVDSYKAATNWSTYASQIRAIEDYPEICGGE